MLLSRSQDAENKLATARTIADEANREYNRLPNVTEAHRARQSAHTARQEAELAHALAIDARAEFDRCDHTARSAFAHLNKVARARGRLLPTDQDAIVGLRRRLTTMRDDIGGWAGAVTRTHTLTEFAEHQRAVTERAEDHHREAQEHAKQTKAKAQQAQHRYSEEVRLHERPYRELLSELEQQRNKHNGIQEQITREEQSARSAELAAVQTRASLARAEELLHEADQHTTASLADMQLLFDQGLVIELEQDAELARPETVPEGIETAYRLAGTRDAKNRSDIDVRREAVDRALRELDPRVRRVRDQLIRLGRHLQLEDIPGGWKRITITEQSTSSTDVALSGTNTKSLRVALKELERSTRTLESDFNEQVRTEIKGAVFTELRKHISIRIDLAEQIVEDIRATLASVRTGVARVGVRLSWNPRKKDPIAQEAISLIRKSDRAGAFDRMYEFFVRQFVEPSSPGSESDASSWMEHVYQVFDYRNWYDWEIHLTHADFADTEDSEPVFRAVTAHRNPLDVLSAGEKRLATMLPLLAAIRAFYSVKEYSGPRMIFIDELNAAFDTANLRMVLALLRTWDFDVLATLPSTSPLLVAETGSIAIHEIMAQQEGVRFSIPCIWDGTGQPTTARIAVAHAQPANIAPSDNAQNRAQLDHPQADS
ncbi:SbcC/MukB-like Walker B domain-containing protein [Amycolatopsis echigonensis]